MRAERQRVSARVCDREPIIRIIMFIMVTLLLTTDRIAEPPLVRVAPCLLADGAGACLLPISPAALLPPVVGEASYGHARRMSTPRANFF